MTEPSLERDPLDALAESFVARFRRGERPSLSEYINKNPELADRIRKLFPALVVLEELGSVGGPAAEPSSSLVADADPVPRELGEYLILREVGRGGMGIVYEAVQQSLGRHVALKVLPLHAFLKPTHIERFRREARAAAQLHHTNIVPVFGVGEERCIHYYAMQFIHGQGLDEVLHEVKRLRNRPTTTPDAPRSSLAEGMLTGNFSRESGEWRAESGEKQEGSDATTPASIRCHSPPSTRHSSLSSSHSDLTAQPQFQYFRGVAELGVQIAEALDYAHREGILHRDVKPSNLLLDGTGRVWITDFGLAKAEETDELTHLGDIVGTLRYMAPERLQGQADRRSDVYGLGITLYEMLTLSPAFEDSSRAGLIDRIARDEPLTPRRRDPHIPRDLETIVLKAIAKNPADRYASAARLADDLRNFLADRPVRARRISALEQAWRWCRRNPVVAGLTASVLLLLVVIAVGSLVGSFRLREQRDVARQEQAKALGAEREKTEKLFEARLAQAQVGRSSHRKGQRFDGLKAIEEAVQITRSLAMPKDRFVRLRNEAIACLALPDIRLLREWDCPLPGPVALNFDPALHFYAAVDLKGRGTLRSIDNDQEIFSFSVAGAATPSFSPDARFLAVATDKELHVWDLAGREPALVLHEPYSGPLAFRPDSRRLAIAAPDGAIVIHELPSGKRVRTLPLAHLPRALAYHPSKDQLAIAFANRAQVYDLQTATPIWDNHQDYDRWPTIAWHPEGRVLAMAEKDWIISFWDIFRYKKVNRLEGHKHAGIRMVFDRAGDLLASYSWDGFLRLWDSRTGKPLFATSLGESPVFEFDADDRLLALDHSGSKLRLWEVSKSREYQELAQQQDRGKTDWIDVSVSPSGRLLGVGTTKGFGFCDLGTGRTLGFFNPQDWVHVTFDEHTADLITSSPAASNRWAIRPDIDVPGLLRLGPPQALTLPGSYCRPACSRDGRVIASPQLWGALVTHRNRPTQLVRLSPHDDVRGVAVSPDGRYAVTASHGSSQWVKVWETDKGRLIKDLAAGYGSSHVAFSPNGRWLASCGLTVQIWETGTWHEVARIPAMAGAGAVAFSPDDRCLAFETGSGAVSVVVAETGQEVGRLENPEQARSGCLAFTPDGTKIVAGSGDIQSILVWDLRAIGKELKALGLEWDLAVDSREGADRESPVSIALAGDRVPSELSDDIVLEAEHLAIVDSRDCVATTQSMAPWSAHHWGNDHQLMCSCEIAGYVEVAVNWPDTGKYQFLVAFTQAPDYGIVESSLDGKTVGGRFDGYDESVHPAPLRDMGTVDLKAGPHVLRFTAVDTESGKYLMGIDYLVFKPVK